MSLSWEALPMGTVSREDQSPLNSGSKSSRDLTAEVEALRRELARSDEELSCLKIDLEKLASRTAHDFQEPLRMISMYLSLLEKQSEGRLDDESREYVQFAAEGAKRVKALFADLVRFLRVTGEPLAFGAVDLNAVVERAEGRLRASVEETHARISTEDFPEVRGHAELLTAVFANLVSNAIKFRGKAEPEIKIRGIHHPTEYEIIVEDNGIGIPPGQKDRLFGVYERLDHGTKYPGSGLGLAICRRIVERHGGHIWAESRPQAGAVFHFTLPLA